MATATATTPLRLFLPLPALFLPGGLLLGLGFGLLGLALRAFSLLLLALVFGDTLLSLLLLQLPVKRRPLFVRALVDTEGVTKTFVLLLLPSGLNVGIGVLPSVPLPSAVLPLPIAPATTHPASIISASGRCSYYSGITVGGDSRLLSICVYRHVTGGSGSRILTVGTCTDTFHSTGIGTGTGSRNCRDHLGRLGTGPLGGLLALPPLLLPSVGLFLALAGDALLDLLLAEPALVFEALPQFQEAILQPPTLVVFLNIAVAALPPASTLASSTTATRWTGHIATCAVSGRRGPNEAAVRLDMARRRAAADARQANVVVHAWFTAG